jgi:hypothetical protein
MYQEKMSEEFLEMLSNSVGLFFDIFYQSFLVASPYVEGSNGLVKFFPVSSIIAWTHSVKSNVGVVVSVTRILPGRGTRSSAEASQHHELQLYLGCCRYQRQHRRVIAVIYRLIWIALIDRQIIKPSVL